MFSGWLEMSPLGLRNEGKEKTFLRSLLVECSIYVEYEALKVDSSLQL